MDELEIIIVYNKEDENVNIISDIVRNFFVESYYSTVTLMNTKSSKFIEKRTANSLLSQHGTSKTPLILFRKKGVSVRAIYSEEIKDVEDYTLLLPKKYEEAVEIEVTLEEVEDFE